MTKISGQLDEVMERVPMVECWLMLVKRTEVQAWDQERNVERQEVVEFCQMD